MKKLATLAALSSVCFLSACSHTPPVQASSRVIPIQQVQEGALDITSQIQSGQPIHLNGKKEVFSCWKQIQQRDTTGLFRA